MRKLTNADSAQALEYISSEPEMNLFIFGDIERFGLDGQTVEIYVNEKPDGWDFLLLRYLESYILYSRSADYDAGAAADFLSGREVNILSGKSDLLEKILPHIPGRHGQRTYMARLEKVLRLPDPPAGCEFRRLGPEDAAQIVAFYRQIEEFSATYAGREEKAVEEQRVSLANGGRCWGAFLDGKLSAAAASSAENSVSAMIVGVATLPEARARGLASSLVSMLCAELLGEGKEFICLFYDNPAAGSIYRKIGFREIGGYMMVKAYGGSES